jgi:hypothetical protein
LSGIDTEGDNQWDARARANQTFENLYALPRLQEFFERHGVRPTYLMTHPVASDPKSAEVLRSLLARGNAEVGAHHHAWETPPYTADDIARHAYALSLPLERFDAQLAALTTAVEEGVGRQPVSYRSGRFGFSATHVSSLERHGYLVESSVAPLFYEAHKHGPDFTDAPLAPYFLSYDCATRQGSSRLLELPISSALNRPVPAMVARCAPGRLVRIRRSASCAASHRERAMAAPVVQLCCRHDGARASARARRTAHPQLVVSFERSDRRRQSVQSHRGQLEAFFDRLGAFLRYATGELGVTPLTFGEFRAIHLKGGAASERAAASEHTRAAWGAGSPRASVPGSGGTKSPDRYAYLPRLAPLPPDQGANALLPAELGRRMSARGDAVAFVAHEPDRWGRGDARPGCAVGRRHPAARCSCPLDSSAPIGRRAAVSED